MHTYPLNIGCVLVILMLDALARFISRYAKIIFAVWVVAILIMIPTAVKSLDSSEMSMDATESSEGQEILDKYFHSTGITENPVLVLSYNTPEGYNQFNIEGKIGLVDFIINWFELPIYDAKLQESGGAYILDSSVKKDSGLVAIGFKYVSGTSEQAIIDDTPNLRSDVNNAISAYLTYIGVPVKYFNSYVTGNSAILYDSKAETLNTLSGAVIIVLLIAVVLMGLFFGSIMTSVVTTVSIAFSTILTLTLMKLLASLIVIPTVIWLVVLFLCVAMSFIFCVLYIASYRRQILCGVDKDSALAHCTLSRGRIFIVCSLCMIAVGVVFSVCDSNTFRALGLCLLVMIISVLAVSLTVPASMICVTKNELFWSRTSDGRIKSENVEKVSSKVDKAFVKVSNFSDRFSVKGSLAIIVVISLIAVGAAGYVVFKDVNTDQYDLTNSAITGESKDGLIDLENHNRGGLFQPYSVTLKCNTSIGTIEEVTTEKESYRVINWNPNASVCYNETHVLEAKLQNSTDSNIYEVTTFVMWDKLVEMAKKELPIQSSVAILAYISTYLENNNIVAFQGYQEELHNIGIATPDEIVYKCGPRLDFAMNKWLSDIGSENKDGKLTIDYVSLSVFTKDTCTSDKVVNITNNINSAVNSFMNESKTFSKSWVSGVGSSYSTIYNESSTYYVLIAIAVILVFLILFIAERDIVVPIAITLSSAIGMFISSAIIIFVNTTVSGTISTFILMTVPIFAMTFCVWFGYMQVAMMRNYGSISEMQRSFNPVIIVSALVIGLASFLLLFSDVAYISEMGFAVGVMILVDAFVIRMLFSPAVWTVGIEHNTKFFSKYSK